MFSKFANEVSVNELMEMRDSGMSNSEIANVLGVSYSTIYAYIGKQPQGVRRKPSRVGGEHITHAPAETAVEPEGMLVLTDCLYSLTGECLQYILHPQEKTLGISNGGGGLTIQIDKLAGMIDELRIIARKIGAMSTNQEVW